MAKILTLVAILTLVLSAQVFAREMEVESWEVLAAYAQPGVVADDGSAEAGQIELEDQGSESAEGGLDEGFDRRAL
ncbi:MAG TPA: hypothetical protein VFJ45_06340 [bacterium]|nr:hypothetical protein [bacterium]